jgi:hypothetical protein
MKFLLIILVTALTGLTVPASAQEDITIPVPLSSPGNTLLEPQRAENNPPVTTLDPEDIPEEYIIEAEQVHRACLLNQVTNMFFDCECYSIKFLDKRIEQGPEPPQSHLLVELEGSCPNPVAVAGYTFENCTEQMFMREIYDNEELCTCVANAVANNYTEMPRLNSISLISLNRNSYLDCGLGEIIKRRIYEEQIIRRRQPR